MSPDEVLRFWFQELTPAHWFRKDHMLDEKIKTRFGKVHEAARSGHLQSWRSTVKGRLAEIIVLDQFSRNIHRGTGAAFAQDDLALSLAQELVDSGGDRELSTNEKAFAYMPFMHSESPEIHELALRLFSQNGLEENFRFELLHKDIINQFGRYPHRNSALGRRSTPAEIEFLQTHPGF